MRSNMSSLKESTPKLFCLRVHQATQNEQDIQVSLQTGSELRQGDIVEIYKEDDDKSCSHIILRISSVDETVKTKGTETVSIIDSICNNSHFNFKTFNHVYLKKVIPEPVDLVVVTCKDTYLSRGDMWRMKKHLEDQCVYIDKRISFLDIKMQLSVSEIWCKGESLASGYISNSTRVCFRSSTSVLHIFLQMSAEMWEYDSYGDLYFEKAVSGFLADLFAKWKTEESAHDVTIVMFSRTFYEAKTLADFPQAMRADIQMDSDNRFYEDFYRVVIKNERYEDWKSTLVRMKQLFINYEDKVLRVKERAQDPSIPKAYNSSAAQGNYLEVINMSLNVFEKYFLDRNFDRLGKTAVVITPGPGVFEVDQDLMSITKHRTIDSGSAADLICMGEQPLHTVPWFKVKEAGRRTEVPKIPKSWINHSFYTSRNQMRITSTAQFVPRIKVASKKTADEVLSDSLERPRVFPDISEIESNEEIDYDAYDSNVFKSTSKRSRGAGGMNTLRKNRQKVRLPSEESGKPAETTDKIKRTTSMITTKIENMPEKETKEVSFSQEEEGSFNASSVDKGENVMSNMQQHKLDKQVDPFNPNSVNKQKTANRRRWVHAFPIDKNGQEIQPHHIYVDDPRLPVSSHKLLTSSRAKIKYRPLSSTPSLDRAGLSEISSSLDEGIIVNLPSYRPGSVQDSNMRESSNAIVDTESGDFSPMTKTGVDWRSLTTPALLPITTDYYPDEQQLERDYQVQNYMLDPLLDSPTNYAEFFTELVSIRLALGFQLIQAANSEQKKEPADLSSIKRASNKNASSRKVYRLSVGKIFHELSFSAADCSITVKVQQPKKTVRVRQIEYKYQFMSPDCNDYNDSVTKFVSEQPECYKWNILDNYVINRGSKDDENQDTFNINNESMKYWCSRFCLLPMNNNAKVKKIREIVNNQGCLPICDIFNPVEAKDYGRHNDGFVRFLLEMINCVKRVLPGSSAQFTEDQRFDLPVGDSRRMVELMKDSNFGLPFVDGKAAGLPPCTFVSYDAMLWIRKHCKHVHDNREALQVLQKLLDEKLIEHISHGQRNFLCGVYLFYITSMNPDSSPQPVTDSADAFYFDKEWVEVTLAVLPNDCMFYPSTSNALGPQRRTVSPQKHSRQSSYTPNTAHSLSEVSSGYKSSDIDAHMSRLAKEALRRVEWTSFKYHSFYHPCSGFDFQLNWIVATGGLLYKMINSWKRKLTNSGFHLLPIPIDPFALPTEKNSDPLRGPIFVPLDPVVISSISDEVLVDFMASIIKRFGFIPIVYNYKGTSDPASTQFIHSTGGFFVLIRKKNDSKPFSGVLSGHGTL
ncbi:GATOR complex protein Iml1-like isoform X2 [Watersipora subatra]|uniref:GATOR complex protein Iml1-like isoform X2 n=1 Tax=Watersipora subatra TaxID=2589382 RepID=UPI00355B8811